MTNDRLPIFHFSFFIEIMLTYFPVPYPDELFYSVIARYSDVMQYPSISAIFRELFGANKMPSVLFARGLQHLVKILPEGHSYTVDRFID